MTETPPPSLVNVTEMLLQSLVNVMGRGAPNVDRGMVKANARLDPVTGTKSQNLVLAMATLSSA